MSDGGGGGGRYGAHMHGFQVRQYLLRYDL